MAQACWVPGRQRRRRLRRLPGRRRRARRGQPGQQAAQRSTEKNEEIRYALEQELQHLFGARTNNSAPKNKYLSGLCCLELLLGLFVDCGLFERLPLFEPLVCVADAASPVFSTRRRGVQTYHHHATRASESVACATFDLFSIVQCAFAQRTLAIANDRGRRAV